ncbi:MULTISPECIES: phosphate signaling complex protein PhoU [unclassified Aeromicrobium]|jgi:phosphate transport system protein|uniref:phosphate signaling complex protein PhoU n=1 Tax=unclassified Aeromicrobium TaxID=2633570 RepID=UPI0006F488FB|nr:MULTISPECIES: phosphate signaling complex protein PhoU [unclassified Aeromicrobium]KQO36348.1 PhoU family transcriptional regulator [Aeromicrobium sp. Leaf245]KQP27818.1 PhoU family transcriptional regulator [Aeromicrobium sp. Leaf272]KQP84142.1 PhoU family transcriptional regulator [Aeromicrobium sp. Leaf291]RYY49017.1 MAG: phosphate signaling complex protein PhoU [Actinomycetales bacterium]
MRDAYYEQLDTIVDDLVQLTGTVRKAVAASTAALLNADGPLAEQVIAGDKQIDESTEEIEERALLLLATQQPVATDLRQLVATLRMLTDLQRMGDLSVHVAKVARMRMPDVAVPTTLQPTIMAMASVADQMIHAASRIVANRDIDAATKLEDTDDEMDRLRKDLFRALLGGTWEHGIEPAIDLALLGRYYERIGDHAVSMARRVVYLVTGELAPGV